MKKVIALILGGGQGKRLFPLTMYRSKPAVPIGGKYRLIDIPISNCLHSNLKDIYVLTQFNSESLNNHVNNTYRFDYFSRAFVRILAAEQTLDNTHWFQGTADAVRKNIFHLDLVGDEDILILSGDHLYNMDYRDLIHFHRARGADFTVSVFPVRKDEAKEYGIIRLGKSGRIDDFREKPKGDRQLAGFKLTHTPPFLSPPPFPAYLASMGVYMFNARILGKVLEGDDIDFGREVIPHSIKRCKGYGFIFNGYWKDVGTMRSFYEANIDLAMQKTHLSFLYEGEVFTRPRFLPPARVVTCTIERSLIAEGCHIKGAHITDSIVGLRTVIGKACRISKTVIMGADAYEDRHSREQVKIGIGEGTHVRRAIIDKNARIGKNVVIRNIRNLKDCDAEDYYIRDGIVIIPKNAVIRDGSKI